MCGRPSWLNGGDGRDNVGAAGGVAAAIGVATADDVVVVVGAAAAVAVWVQRC